VQKKNKKQTMECNFMRKNVMSSGNKKNKSKDIYETGKLCDWNY